jgi:hypothetical protein
VFKTGFFFKPAIVFGSKEAIEEYRAFEASLPADEALPETFRELHTAYGALRQSGKEHKARGSARSVRACVFMTMRVCVRKTVRVCERGRLCGCVRERLCVCVSERACVRVRVCLSLRVVCERHLGGRRRAPTSARCWGERRWRTTRRSSRGRRATSCRGSSWRRARCSPGRVGTFHNVILQSKHQLMTAGMGKTSLSIHVTVTNLAPGSAIPKSRYECRQFCLKSLFELFIGTVPPEETMMKMYDYNEGLLALGKISPEFTGGKQALEDLTAFILNHYRVIRAQDKLDDPEYFFLKQYSDATDENGELFTDERVATTCVLMVWGAYIEAAASMGHTAWLLLRNPEVGDSLLTVACSCPHGVKLNMQAPFVLPNLRCLKLNMQAPFGFFKPSLLSNRQTLVAFKPSCYLTPRLRQRCARSAARRCRRRSSRPGTCRWRRPWR